MSKHTPGPWNVNPNPRAEWIAIATNEHDLIATIDTPRLGSAKRTGEPEANANLIAAAPELLAVLEQWDTALAFGSIVFDDDSKRERAEALTRAAIAKATGN